MPRERFAAEMDRLRDTLVEMGHLVLDRLADAAAALEHEDEARARRSGRHVRAPQPRGIGAEGLVSDVSTLLLTVRDLERIGDHAVNVAARTLYVTEGDDSLLE